MFRVITRTLVGGVLPLCRDTVSIFCRPSLMGQSFPKLPTFNSFPWWYWCFYLGRIERFQFSFHSYLQFIKNSIFKKMFIANTDLIRLSFNIILLINNIINYFSTLSLPIIHQVILISWSPLILSHYPSLLSMTPGRLSRLLPVSTLVGQHFFVKWV